MNDLNALVKRHTKLFFKDKGLFFTSLITPIILLVLYMTFLANVYRDSFLSVMPKGFEMSESLLNGLVGGQLVSSLLAVSCVTVSFCSNMLMVQDKVTGARNDLTITPIKPSKLALSYYVSSFLTTMIISLFAMCASFLYLASAGWYLSATDILFIILDTFLLVMFGTALSSIINYFLSSQGQISAVGTIMSAGYGFICGAYMPISQFSDSLQKIISFLPGTYGTSLLRNHSLQGVFAEMETQGISSELIEALKDSIDCNVYFFGEKVEMFPMYIILCLSVIVLMGIYVMMNMKIKKITR